ncbi:hypothetical protein CONLIGDRAFT_675182 [Coniochaeta ligniaria NRRL 30616]|uniref:Uncharacterized protein n=1 Tax=Coniochaeta ligniaria NRRL 30616 TaxID=1408157 RepID=A0A1J7IX71_9PEZI|nr:hypothetical protein CONLIGDRAFT_675182 [Coniochaeta ligniaria NRRL 30616]
MANDMLALTADAPKKHQWTVMGSPSHDEVATSIDIQIHMQPAVEVEPTVVKTKEDTQPKAISANKAIKEAEKEESQEEAPKDPSPTPAAPRAAPAEKPAPAEPEKPKEAPKPMIPPAVLRPLPLRLQRLSFHRILRLLPSSSVPGVKTPSCCCSNGSGPAYMTLGATSSNPIFAWPASLQSPEPKVACESQAISLNGAIGMWLLLGMPACQFRASIMTGKAYRGAASYLALDAVDRIETSVPTTPSTSKSSLVSIPNSSTSTTSETGSTITVTAAKTTHSTGKDNISIIPSELSTELSHTQPPIRGDTTADGILGNLLGLYSYDCDSNHFGLGSSGWHPRRWQANTGVLPQTRTSPIRITSMTCPFRRWKLGRSLQFRHKKTDEELFGLTLNRMENDFPSPDESYDIILPNADAPKDRETDSSRMPTPVGDLQGKKKPIKATNPKLVKEWMK